jgi:hypothetical protein
MSSPRTNPYETPPAKCPASVWRRARFALGDDEVVHWIGRPVAWRVALVRAVPTGCGLILGLVSVGVLAAADAVLRRCGLDVWIVRVSFWTACALSGCAFLALAIAIPCTVWAARRNVYVVTDRRAVIVLSRGTTLSYPPAGMRDLIVRRYPGGGGEILFEFREVERREYSSDPDGSSRVTYRREVHKVGFLELADAEAPRRALEALLGRELPDAPAPAAPASAYHFPL